MRSYSLPISDRAPLVWILREERTAFPSYRRGDAAIGVATVTAPAQDLDGACDSGKREFPIGVELAIVKLVRLGEGVEVARWFRNSAIRSRTPEPGPHDYAGRSCE